MNKILNCGFAAMISCTLMCGTAFAADYSYENQSFPDDGSWRERVDMKGEDPDWSEYSFEDFKNIEFEYFADGIVPEYSLNQKQLDYLNLNYPSVIYKQPQVDYIESSENDLIQLTINMFNENGMKFYLDDFHKKLLTVE